MSICKCTKSCRLLLWREELRSGGEYSLGACAAIAALEKICDRIASLPTPETNPRKEQQ